LGSSAHEICGLGGGDPFSERNAFTRRMNIKIDYRTFIHGGMIPIHRRLCLVAALGVALFASALDAREAILVGQPRRPTDEATIRKLEEERRRAIFQLDYPALERIFSERLVVNNPGGNFVSPNRRVVFDRLNRNSSFEIAIECIVFNGDVIIVMGGETLTNDSATAADRTVQRRYTDIWNFENGAWLMIARQATRIPAAADASANAKAQGDATDLEAIKQLQTDFESAWNRHDMKALAATVAEDVDFVALRGRWLKGRKEFEEYHSAIHTKGFKESVRTTTDVRVKFLKPDIAIVQVTGAIKGVIEANGTLLEPMPVIFTRIVTKEAGKWLIKASQNTLVGEPQKGG